MKEYLVFSVVSLFLPVLLDAKFKTAIFKSPRFYLFIVIIAMFKFAVNGYLTGNDVFIYNPYAILGLRIGSIPLEDFFFGFSMVSTTIILWEYFKRRKI